MLAQRTTNTCLPSTLLRYAYQPFHFYRDYPAKQANIRASTALILVHIQAATIKCVYGSLLELESI